MTAANILRNITIGRAHTVHTTADNDGVHATCGASMRRNSHRGASSPTPRPVTCLACINAADSPAADATYNPETDRYELPDGTEEPGCRARRLVEESSSAAFWGER